MFSLISKSFFLPISALYSSVFSVSGPVVMFFAVFLASRSLTPAQIGYAMSAMALGKLMSVFVMTFFIDKSRSPHYFLVGAAFAALIVMSLITFLEIEGAWMIFMTFCFSAAWSINIPFSEAFSMRACRLDNTLNYGTMRLFGSAAFLVSGILVGQLIDWYSIDIYTYYIMIIAFMAMLVGVSLPNFYQLEKNNNIIDDQTIDAQSLRKMFIQNKNLIFIIMGAAIMHSGHAALFQHAAIEWLDSGYSSTTVSYFMGIGIIFEVLLFLCVGRMKSHINPFYFFLIAGIASIVRWVAMVFDLTTAEIFFFQSTHALTFGVLHLGVIGYIRDNLQGHYHGGAQLIYSGCMWGLVMMPISALSGYLYGFWEHNTYYVMALLAFIGLCIILVPYRHSFRLRQRVA